MNLDAHPHELRATVFARPVEPQPDHFHRDIIGKPEPWKHEDWTRLLPQKCEAEIHCPWPGGSVIGLREEAWYDECFGGRAFFPDGWCIKNDGQPPSRPPHPCTRELLDAVGLQERRDAKDMPEWAIRRRVTVARVEVRKAETINNDEAERMGFAGSYSPAYVAGGEIIGPDGTEPSDEFRRWWNSTYPGAAWLWLITTEEKS